VYSPLFSGVFWDVQNVMLEDVERIEVVSGPGGTLWGVNAVNGVINVITRAAGRTQGTLVAANAGRLDSQAGARYGASLGETTNFRVYGKYFDHESTSNAGGALLGDALYIKQAGFRADGGSALSQWTLLGNAYRGAIGQPRAVSASSPALPPSTVEGANLTGRWARQLGAGSDVALQFYYDRTERTVPATFAEKLDIFDVEWQHSIAWGSSTSVVWGGEVRYSNDRIANGASIAFLPATIHQGWESLFAQADANVAEHLKLTVGARLERNDYTGTEFLPSARLAWKPGGDHLLWSAASRTVRAPSRLDRDAFFPGQPPFILRGGPGFESEVANVYEVGYRGQAAQRVSYSITVFHADYDRLHTQQIAPDRTFVVFANGMEAKTTGVEAWGTLQASSAWRLSAGYTAERQRFSLKPGSNDAGAVALAGRDPAHSWLLRSSLAVSQRLDLDATVRAVAALSSPVVPRYTVLDLRIGWRPQPGVELEMGARNLGGRHSEFGAVATRTEIDRSVFVGVRWNFDAH
jgi:iron complex outermembrane receptor protein